MISPIFKIQNRGQVVNNACQWLWEHRRLAFRLMALPTLIGAIVLGLNIVFIDSDLIYVLAFLYAVLLLPVLPCLMFHVVENPEISGYPERMPKIKVILRPWWRYFWPLLLISIVSFIAMLLASFTIFGGFFISLVMPLAVVIAQRDEDAGIGALLQAFKMAKDSFGNFCMVGLGCSIISLSLTFAPFAMVYGITAFLKVFLTKAMLSSLTTFFKGDVFEAIPVFVLLLGMVFSVQIVTVIYHFFYGHCVEKESHPALIERMENFDEE